MGQHGQYHQGGLFLAAEKLKLFLQSADDELDERLKNLARDIVRWAFRVLKYGPPVWVAHKFDWLMPILNWLQHQPWVQAILKGLGL